MKRFGQVSAIVAIAAALFLGFGCGGAAQAGMPVSGHHHHHSSGAPGQDGAILVHGSCCVSMPGPSAYVSAVVVRNQPVTWPVPAEAVAAGQRISPEPRPPKSRL